MKIVLLFATIVTLTFGSRKYLSSELLWLLNHFLLASALGSPLESDQFVPYIVSITESMFYGQHIASGSILSERFVLTNAHSLRSSSASTLLVITGITFTWEFGTERYRVSEILIHPNFNTNMRENDIALLQTTTSINFHERVNSIDLSHVILGHGDAIISGFGLDDLNQATHNPLESIESRVITNEECRQILGVQNGERIFNSKACVLPNDERVICINDYGAPVTVNNQLVGFSSWNVPCMHNSPIIVERISSHLDFIGKHVH